MTESDSIIIKHINDAIQQLIHGKFSKELLDFSIDDLKNISPEVEKLFSNTHNIISKIHESNSFINALSNGDLNTEAPPRNFLISSFKQLQSNLRHLTWQTQQIASGDYSQQVSFMGDFSVSFNKLIIALKEKKLLEDELKASEQNLRELNTLKDKMFSIVGHDLRGPVGNIKSLIDLIIETEDYSDTEQLKRIS